MTAQPINVITANPIGTQKVVASQTSSSISKSKNVNSSNPYGKTMTSSNPVSTVSTEAASLDISSEGAGLLKNAGRLQINSSESAQSYMKDVTESIKNNSDATRSLHSNLRIMKVNQLVLD